MQLKELAKGYLLAEGYNIVERGKDLLVGTRKALGEVTNYIYVWVPKIDPNNPSTFRSQERPYLERFKEADDLHPSAEKFFLTQSSEGLSKTFTDGVSRWHNVKIRVPVQFFDTVFKWEESEEAATAAKNLQKQGNINLGKRIHQPFNILDNTESEEDLLEFLYQRLRHKRNDNKNVHIVVGPAGIGKSYMFESLFAKLYQDFIRDKNAQHIDWCRPLPLLPQYMQFSSGPTIKALLNAFLQTEFVRPINDQVFEWLVSNGYAMWLLDGLDEVIGRDTDFFNYLLDLMTMPTGNSTPTIVLCIRDSLIATNDNLKEFCDEYIDYINIYELQQWGTDSKRDYAEIMLGSKAEGFLDEIRKKPMMDKLASIPYYCHLLSEQYKADMLKDYSSESDLLSDALTNIIERDFNKGSIDSELISMGDVIEFAECIAQEDLKNSFQGIPPYAVNGWAQQWSEMTLEFPSSPDERKRLCSQLTQIGLFTGGSTGYVRFSQEILEQYLLGRWLLRLFKAQPDLCINNLAIWHFPCDWITLRVIAEQVNREGRFQELLALVYKAQGNEIAYKNTVQLAVFTALKPESLRAITFERHDLSSIVFDGVDLNGVSFRDCNLSNVEFHDCNLSKINLTGAIINNTGFIQLKPHGLKDADIGDLSNFYSVRIDKGRYISDYKNAQKWFEAQTGKSNPILEPCPAAMQLRQIFCKFVHADGSARRSWLDKKGVTSGKRYINSDLVVDSCLRHEYLMEDFRRRICRPEGDKYAELIAYVKKWKITPGIKILLTEICDLEGCIHIPKVAE